MEWIKIKRHAAWLMKEDNRTIKVTSKAIFKQGIWGNAKVQRLGVDGKLYEEEDAEDNG